MSQGAISTNTNGTDITKVVQIMSHQKMAQHERDVNHNSSGYEPPHKGKEEGDLDEHNERSAIRDRQKALLNTSGT